MEIMEELQSTTEVKMLQSSTDYYLKHRDRVIILIMNSKYWKIISYSLGCDNRLRPKS